jgi:hypothetical protein
MAPRRKLMFVPPFSAGRVNLPNKPFDVLLVLGHAVPGAGHRDQERLRLGRTALRKLEAVLRLPAILNATRHRPSPVPSAKRVRGQMVPGPAPLARVRFPRIPAPT